MMALAATPSLSPTIFSARRRRVDAEAHGTLTRKSCQRQHAARRRATRRLRGGFSPAQKPRAQESTVSRCYFHWPYDGAAFSFYDGQESSALLCGSSLPPSPSHTAALSCLLAACSQHLLIFAYSQRFRARRYLPIMATLMADARAPIRDGIARRR